MVGTEQVALGSAVGEARGAAGPLGAMDDQQDTGGGRRDQLGSTSLFMPKAHHPCLASEHSRVFYPQMPWKDRVQAKRGCKVWLLGAELVLSLSELSDGSLSQCPAVAALGRILLRRVQK